MFNGNISLDALKSGREETRRGSLRSEASSHGQGRDVPYSQKSRKVAVAPTTAARRTAVVAVAAGHQA